MNPVYFLDIDIGYCDAGVFLNGAPIMRTTAKQTLRCSPPVSPWVIDGENTLEITIEGDGTGDESHIGVSLSSGEPGSIPEPGTSSVHACVDWSPQAGSMPGNGPVALTTRAALTHPWGTWAWQTAPLLTLDDAAASDLTGFLQTLHAGLAEHRLDPLITASRIKLEEVGRCFDITPAAIKQQMQAGIRRLFDTPECSLAPLDTAGPVIRPCCDGRLVQPLTPAGKPVLHLVGPDGKIAWFLDLFIARIDGAFCIVR